MDKRIRKILKNPLLLFMTLGHREKLNWIDDELYLKIAFRASHGYFPNLREPKTYSEKLQWLKLHNRNPLYTRWVDKYEAKLLAADIIGEEYIIPTLGVWNHFDEIDFDSLPDQFVLKCTHDSGGLVICKDKSKLDKAAARQKIETCLKHSYYWGMREWPYKNVPPRILAEPYMEDAKTHELRDYKFFAFDGIVKAMLIITERGSGEEPKTDCYDADFNHLDLRRNHPNAAVRPEKPEHFEDMKALAAKLSAGIAHVRVDFYEANGRVYFGEMTFFPSSGLVPFDPVSWDETFGEWLDLSRISLDTQKGRKDA